MLKTKESIIKTARRVLLVIAVLLCLRFLTTLVQAAKIGAAAEKNPMEFLPSLFYMLIRSKSMFLAGIWTTVRIALFGTAIAFVLAVLLVFVRIQTPQRQDGAAAVLVKEIGTLLSKLYITVIRGTPMMVQTLIIYYIGFGIFKNSGMSVTEINRVWSCFISGLITVSLNSTAYLTEVLRGGIESIDPGQAEAARSLGMSNWQTMRKVVFPQAVKNSIPAIGNEFIINIKDSSVLSVIGVMDLMYATKSVSGIYFRSLEIYCVAAILYLILTWLSSKLLQFLGKKLDTPVKGIPSSN